MGPTMYIKLQYSQQPLPSAAQQQQQQPSSLTQQCTTTTYDIHKQEIIDTQTSDITRLQCYAK